jgi:hypothetical protein
MLRERGYEATGVVEQDMGGWKDSDLWDTVQAEQRFLITADKGFADVRLYPPGTHAGVLLLRPDEDGIRPILELLESVLSGFNLDSLARTITVVNPRGIRVRRPN